MEGRDRLANGPGAGKSSCLQALFCIVELSADRTLVHGREIASVGVTVGLPWRTCVDKGLSTVPQDRDLFSGTIHSNLDALINYYICTSCRHKC